MLEKKLKLLWRCRLNECRVTNFGSKILKP